MAVCNASRSFSAGNCRGLSPSALNGDRKLEAWRSFFSLMAGLRCVPESPYPRSGAKRLDDRQYPNEDDDCCGERA